MRVLQIVMVMVLLAGVVYLVRLPSKRTLVLGSYATSLVERSHGQIENATRAAQALNGARISPGGVLSFNTIVGPWTPDRGYVLAPVSYSGELVVDWGGGVCQSSTTLYNAALLAGLEVPERHPHNWAPGYIPAGQDAAVAQFDVDLKLRNPYPWPVIIRSHTSDTAVIFEILGQEEGPMARVWQESLGQQDPVQVIKYSESIADGHRRMVTKGRPGPHAAVYRTFLKGTKAGTQELVSEDAYPAMHRIIEVGK
jgi:vancomycin resistance protein VanW